MRARRPCCSRTCRRRRRRPPRSATPGITPAGVRGVSSGSRAAQYGQSAGYLRTADEQICILAQIETPQALDNLEAIAPVRRVDGLFIGPNDLAAPMGYLGDSQHPVLQAAVDDAFERLRRWTSSPAT